MDDANPIASSMIIEGNRIVAVGESPRAGDDDDHGDIRVINAKRKLAIPGIIDEHLHWIRSAITWGYHLHAGENVFTLADLEVAIKARARDVPPGEWITLIGRHNFKQFLENPSDPNGMFAGAR
jgi:predicted amidohydrolase YtcJ